MRKKRTKYPIDMTKYQPVIDAALNGYLDLSDNLGSLLIILESRGRLCFKTQKVLVKVSKIGFRTNDKDHEYPFRYESERLYTVNQLLGIYENTKGYPFEAEKFKESQCIETRALEVRAAGRAAWGAYSTIVRTNNKRGKEKGQGCERQDKESQALLYIG